jgi:hypothetical protein
MNGIDLTFEYGGRFISPTGNQLAGSDAPYRPAPRSRNGAIYTLQLGIYSVALHRHRDCAKRI